jgi:hypothetical protein
MKKNLIEEEVSYSVNTVTTPSDEKVDEILKIHEQIESEVPQVEPKTIKVMLNEKKLDGDKLSVFILKESFKDLFGGKPRKGDVMSIMRLNKTYGVKSAKKIKVKKLGKGYKISLKSK